MDWLALFRARYPQFDDVEDAVVQTYIDDALLLVDEGVWGELYTQGVLALTCHEMTLDGLGDSKSLKGGNVISKMAGDVSVFFKMPKNETTGDDYYLQTRCGQKYLNLMRLVGPGIVVIPAAEF